jgi:hypothetical protein
MSALNYESIRPLIASEQVRANTVYCTFRCPVTGFLVESRSEIPPWLVADLQVLPRKGEPESVTENGFFDKGRSAVFGALAQMFGREKGTDSPITIETDPEHAPLELQKAVLQAFRQVRHLFQWNEQVGQWESLPQGSEAIPPASPKIAKPLSADFVAQMRSAPIVDPEDRVLLVRALAEVASTDGRIDAEEQGFLDEFLGHDHEPVETLLKRARLSINDLHHIYETPVGETILMLSWGLALTNEELTESETERLTLLAEQLGISSERAGELKRFAQYFLLEALLEDAEVTVSGLKALHRQVVALGQRIGLTEAEIPLMG